MHRCVYRGGYFGGSYYTKFQQVAEFKRNYGVEMSMAQHSSLSPPKADLHDVRNERQLNSPN